MIHFIPKGQNATLCDKSRHDMVYAGDMWSTYQPSQVNCPMCRCMLNERHPGLEDWEGYEGGL